MKAIFNRKAARQKKPLNRAIRVLQSVAKLEELGVVTYSNNGQTVEIEDWQWEDKDKKYQETLARNLFLYSVYKHPDDLQNTDAMGIQIDGELVASYTESNGLILL